MKSTEVRERIIVALDFESEEETLKTIHELKDFIGFFKIGLGLLNNIGYNNAVFSKIRSNHGKIFLDGKFHDIPNTVASASRGVVRHSVNMFNLHISGGMAMMKSAVEASKAEAQRIHCEPPLILGVTVLTSIDTDILSNEVRITEDLSKVVVHYSKMAQEAGLDGVIASPHEIELIRNNTSDDFIIVTPGIRPQWAAANDQKRIMTPKEAIQKGANYLVIGRAITNPPRNVGTPMNAIELILDEIS